jgi:hypothetical protein
MTASTLREDIAHQVGVADIALDEGHVRRHRPAPPGRQIIDCYDAMSGFAEGENGMAADEAGCAGNEDGAHAPIIDRRLCDDQGYCMKIRLQFREKGL